MKLYEAKDLIEEVFEHAFDKDRFTRLVKNLLKDIEEKTFTYQGNIIPNAFENYIRKMDRIGKFEDEEGNSIDILVVELLRDHSIEYARSAQRNFVRWYLSGSRGGQMKDAALVAFHSEKSTDWRFSLIKMQYSLETKKDEFTPAKRFSFLVGEKGKSHTAQRQLVNLLKSDDIPLLNDLEQAFNIESVTNEFFEKYKALVFNLEESLKHILVNDPTVKKEFETKKIDSLDFSKKLMGQIVFLYFLQRKGWLGVQKGQEYGDGDRNFLRNLYNQKRVHENFFNDYLEHLFYDALNNNKRSTDFYPRFNCKIPFLNGGLFDPIGFYDWENTTINLLDDIFTNDIKTKEGDSGSGILDIFDLYNFTVNEAEPLEKEVAVDPEMLGKVFERMLDVKERKSKGAFYTPREIVHYMSQESLIHYLDTVINDTAKSYQRLGDEKLDMFGNEGKKGTGELLIQHGQKTLVPKEDFEKFIKKGEQLIDKDTAVLEGRLKESTNEIEIPESIRKHAKLIDEKLRDIRVCDPAVGSGAFPVGVMTEIVKARSILFKLQNPGKEPSHYDFKNHAIHHCLYGVDIDASAVEICKLRLWLSLVVDEQRIDMIEPLPNLDYKIVRGNSLINMPDGVTYDVQLKTDINKLMEKYYAETDKQAKRDLKDEIDGKIKQLLKSAEQFTSYPIDFDFKLYFHEVFKEKGGFDVVIGNPPYVLLQNLDLSIQILNAYSKYYVAQYKTDLFHLFIEKGINLANKIGILTYITPNTFLKNKFTNKLRQYIYENTCIRDVVLFYIRVFEQVSVDNSVFTFCKPKDKYESINVFQIRDEFFEQSLEINKIQFNPKSIKSPEYYMNFDMDGTALKINSIIKEKSFPLKEIGNAYFGIQTFDRKKYVSMQKVNSYFQPVIDGSNITRYHIAEAIEYVDFSQKSIKSGGNKSVYESDRIVVRQIGKYPEGAICAKGIYTLNTIYNINITNSYYNLHYILAIINSSLIKYFWLTNFSDNKMTFPKIKKHPLESLPIIRQDPKIQNIFERLVKYLVYLQSVNNKNVKVSLSYFEQLIDGMVFELYFEDEVKKAGRDILKYLTDLQPITDDMSDDQKMQIITKTFNELYDKNHPVRQNLYYMDTIEEIRIIKGLD